MNLLSTYEYPRGGDVFRVPAKTENSWKEARLIDRLKLQASVTWEVGMVQVQRLIVISLRLAILSPIPCPFLF